MDEQSINFIHDDVDNNINNNISKQPCITIIHGFLLGFIVKKIFKITSIKKPPYQFGPTNMIG
jgi:hypothetical protein